MQVMKKRKLKMEKKQPSNAVIKIKIRDEEDIVIEKIARDHDEQVVGNEEIAMIRDNSL